ncbi:AEC family transporter [Kaarinaea lacus]
MSEFFHILSFAFSVTGPIFVILALGIILARMGVITDAFIDAGSKLVFNVTLPALLFITISKTDIEHIANFSLIGYGLMATFAVFVILEMAAVFFINPPQDRGVVVQGAFRSNMGIVGLAYCVNAYGEVGLAAASIYLGPVTILFNVLAVITLNRSLNKHRSVAGTLIDIARNPLILGIVLALPVAWTNLQLPSILLQSGEYFAQMTLPLALLCTGASLSLRALREDSRNAIIASAGKLIMVPFVITLGGYWLGFRDMDLGILFLMTSSPTAAASYIMVRAMSGNAVLAANIIALTTFGSILVASIGVALLRHQGLM